MNDDTPIRAAVYTLTAALAVTFGYGFSLIVRALTAALRRMGRRERQGSQEARPSAPMRLGTGPDRCK